MLGAKRALSSGFKRIFGAERAESGVAVLFLGVAAIQDVGGEECDDHETR
jgi:hypothetical protein